MNDNLFYCKICNFKSKRLSTLLQHIGYRHKLTSEQYYIKYGTTGKDSNTCVICGTPVSYVNFNVGYANTCSRKCGAKYAEKTCLERYGCTHAAMREQVKQKTRNTNINKYGVSYTSQNPEVRAKQKATSLERYGNECSLRCQKSQEKVKQTLKRHYGEDVINPFQAESVKTKSKQSCLDKYGHTYAMGNEQVFNKVMSSGKRSMKIKQYQYNDHIIHYQTKPQLQFIQLCKQLIYDVYDCKGIKYFHNGRERVTFPDFLLVYPDKTKRIVQIKGDNWYHKQKVTNGQFQAKCQRIAQYSKQMGYLDYIVIMC